MSKFIPCISGEAEVDESDSAQTTGNQRKRKSRNNKVGKYESVVTDATAFDSTKLSAIETNVTSKRSDRVMASDDKPEDIGDQNPSAAVGAAVGGSGNDPPTSGAGDEKQSDSGNASAATAAPTAANAGASAAVDDSASVAVRPKEKNPLKKIKSIETPGADESRMTKIWGSIRSSFGAGKKTKSTVEEKSSPKSKALSRVGETGKDEETAAAPSSVEKLETPTAVTPEGSVSTAATTVVTATISTVTEAVSTVVITGKATETTLTIPSNPAQNVVVAGAAVGLAATQGEPEPKQILVEEEDKAPMAEPVEEEMIGAEAEFVDEGPREIMRLDVIFVCDTTGSMGTSVNSLALTIKQLLSIIKLLFPENRARVAVVSYKDHNLGPICYQSVPFEAPEKDLIRFIDGLRPTGNWDTPEATKTGLHEALRLVTESNEKNGDTSQTIVIHYTDTCPHHDQSRSHLDNKRDAMNHLADKKPGYDWIAISNHFRKLKIPVYTFLTSKNDNLAKVCMSLLGDLIILNDTSTFNITKATVGLLMHLLGESFAHDRDFDLTLAVDKEQLLTLPGERRSDGFPEVGRLTFRSEPFRFDRLETVRHLFNTGDLLKMFNRDEEFVDTVFKELNGLFTVENVMALTYNPILGKLWRLCCRRRTDDRLQTLRDKLMRVVDRLYPQSHKLQLKKWIEESYKTTDEIVETIDSVHRLSPAIYRDLGASIAPTSSAPITDDTLRSLARAPSPSSVSTWISLLTQLHLYEGRASKLPRDKEEVPEFLPTMLEDDDLFKNLPHLYSPGMKFSLKGAVLVAALCHLTDNKYLAERARRYLQEQKGKYLNLQQVVDYPEIMAEEFVKIMYQIREYLLPEEERVYTILYRVSRVKRASRMDYVGKFPAWPSVANLWPDYKIRCKVCKFLRSFTLTMKDDVCGTCQTMKENPKEFGSYVPREGDPTEYRSRLATCFGCKCIYQVVAVEDLKTRPKCHFCRVSKQPSPSVQCVVCSNKYLNPGDVKTRLGLQESDPWTCFICQKEPKRAFAEINFNLHQLANQNSKLIVNFGFREKVNEIVYAKPPVKNLAMFRDAAKWNLLNQAVDENRICQTVFFNERQLLNSSEVIQKIVEDVTSGDLTALCCFCFSDKDIRGLNSPCGKCNNKACIDCLKEWFGNLKPGMLVLTTYLTCAFCKNIPAKATIERYNPAAKALVRGEHLGKMIERMDPGIYYGWCKGCSKVREIADKSCASDVMPFTTNDDFLCEFCQSEQKALTNVPQCPGCGTPTVKAYGCNHIECPTCHTHWCYVCQNQFERNEIYDHLVEAHGSIGVEDAATAEENNAELLGVEPIHVEDEDSDDEYLDEQEREFRRWDD